LKEEDKESDHMNKQLDEVMSELAEVNKRTGFKAREIEVDSEGCMILDANNPADREWYDNDEAYDIIKD